MVKTNVLKMTCKDCGTMLGIVESSADVCMYNDDININKIEYRRT